MQRNAIAVLVLSLVASPVLAAKAKSIKTEARFVSYDADVKKAKDLINKIALELDWVMHEPAPKVVVRNFGESAVGLQARVWIREPRRRMDTISYITDRLKDVIEESDEPSDSTLN